MHIELKATIRKNCKAIAGVKQKVNSVNKYIPSMFERKIFVFLRLICKMFPTLFTNFKSDREV